MPSKNPSGRRSLLYELFVLGELMGGPHHGYLLREILSHIMGPFQQISWGALYPLIRRLEQGGLITPTPDSVAQAAAQTKRGQQRISYEITSTGRVRFYALLLEPVAYSADYSDQFSVKLNYFGHITTEQQIAILKHYRDYLQTEDDYLQRGQQRIRAEMPEEERDYALRLADYQMSTVLARRTWVDAEIARILLEAGQ